MVLKPYKLQFVQTAKADDKQKCKQFYVDVQEKVEEEELYERLVYSNKATFYTNDKVSRHKISIWSEETPHVTIEHERDSKKVNEFCTISKNYVHGPFLFEGDVTGSVYLQMLQNWLMDELIANDGDDFIYQQDGAPPHWKLTVRAYLNDNLLWKRISRAGGEDNVMLKRCSRSSDLTRCDFFLWRYVKSLIYVHPFPANENKLKQRITTALDSVFGRSQTTAVYQAVRPLNV